MQQCAWALSLKSIETRSKLCLAALSYSGVAIRDDRLTHVE
jgi:hypothetical protein